MSGLCAVVHFGDRPVPTHHLERMIAAARYRGPDGVRRWYGPAPGEAGRAGAGGGSVALAHQALNVTRESRLERQPTIDLETGLALVADARIDNREELLDQLADDLPRVKPVDGAPPATPASSGPRSVVAPSDAELILASYRRWGPDGSGRLLGDFAFVIYDPRERRLVVGRDPMGMRPLFYLQQAGRLLVASEIAQILAVPGVEGRLCLGAVAAHLLGDFDHQERTAYQGVRQVPPAHVVILAAGTRRLVRTWDIDPHARLRLGSEDAYAERLRELLADAVRARLRTSDPVGVQLSGGMDSGAVAATAGHLVETGGLAPVGIHAYSWAFDELTGADERHISDRLVRRYGFEKRDVPADEQWPLKDYPDGGPDVGDPFMGVYQLLLANAAARAHADGVRTMMAGNRGDLVVGDNAYDHVGLLLNGRWGALRADLQAYRRWKRVSLPVAARDTLWRPWLATLSTHPASAPAKRLVRSVRPRAARPPDAPPWIRRAFLDEHGPERHGPWRPEPPRELVGSGRRARYKLIFLGLQLKTLTWYERLLAREGITLVDPWSDRRITEMVLATPPWMIQRWREPKRIARLAMRGVMPEDVRTRARKISPEPLYRRALEHRARDTIWELLTNMHAARRGFVDEGVLRAHYETVLAGAPDPPGFWWALTLEMWLRQHEPARGT